jgi:hypothetical protein
MTMKKICVISVFAAACASSHAAPAGGATGAQPMMRMSVATSDPFSPETGAAAVKAFIPEIAPVDSGGECTLRKLPGSSATTATAAFPTRMAPLMIVSMTFDASGRVVRYSETRGVPSTRGKMAVGMSESQRDSVLKAATMAVRSTIISLDYALDQGIMRNRGGGIPDHAVLTSARQVESLPKLGVKERMAHFRKLCGV